MFKTIGLSFCALLFSLSAFADCPDVFSCVMANDEDGLEKVLKSGGNPNAFNTQGNTPLSVAAYYGRRPLVGVLIRYGAQVNLKTKNNSTPLMEACSNVKSEETAKLLLQAGAEPNVQNPRGETAVWIASKGGRLDIVKALIQYRANINLKNETGDYALTTALFEEREEVALELIRANSLLTDVNNAGNFPLIYAAHRGLENATRALLSKNVPINQIGYDKHTALYEAARMGHRHVVDQLLIAKADPNLNATGNYSPLHTASFGGFAEIVTSLLFNGARINEVTAPKKETALMLAAQMRRTSVVQRLIDEGANVDLRDNQGASAVYYAASSNIEALLNFVLSKNPNLNFQNQEGWTALHAAIVSNWLYAIETLAKKGASFTLETRQGMTPLLFSIAQNRQDFSEKLLDLGASIDYQNSIKETPLCYAAGVGKLSFAQLFLDRGANINIQCNEGETATLIASQSQSKSAILDALLAKNPNLEISNKYRVTPLIAATISSNKEAIEKLLAKKANPNVKDDRDQFPLLLAINSNQELIVMILLNGGASPDFKGAYGEAVLHRLAKGYADIKYIDLVLMHGANLNIKNDRGETPLLLAVKNGKEATFTRILQNAPNVDLPETDGYSPLTSAISNGNLKFVQELLKKRANPNLKDSTNLAPLTVASHNRNPEFVNALIDAGATLQLSVSWNQLYGSDRNWFLENEAIVPFKATEANPSLRLDMIAEPPIESQNFSYQVFNKINNQLWSFQEPIDFNSDGAGWRSVNAQELFANTGYRMNRNLYEVKVGVRLGTKTFEAFTAKPLHFFRSQAILFLPGVFGSSLTVDLAGAKTQLFPNVYKPYFFHHLQCSGAGDPDLEAIELDLLKKVELPIPDRVAGPDIFIYDKILGRDDVVNPVGYRKLYGFPKTGPIVNREEFRVPYYDLIAWPYDWRKRLELSVDNLVKGHPLQKPDDSIYAPYEHPSSIRFITERLKRTRFYSDFIDNKVTLVGHSTGGLIIRGALKRPGIERTVEKAFFIDVPFWGAPKAYYVYLTGNMGIPIIPQIEMTRIAPNMPIVYYLAPSFKYPNQVTTAPNVVRSNFTLAGPFMKNFIQTAVNFGFYNRVLNWNDDLDLAAHNFAVAIDGQPNIGWNNTFVFYSDSLKGNTHNVISAMPPEISYTGMAGDGTVPVVSQQADFPASQLIQIRSAPEHVPAPNDNQVWGDIMERVGN